VTDFNSFRPYLVSAINSVIPELFQGIKGVDQNTQLNTDDLKFDESVERNSEATQFSGGALITILIIIFFSISVLVSSVYIWQENKLALKEEEERITRLGLSGSERTNSTSSASRRQEGVRIKNPDSKPSSINRIKKDKRSPVWEKLAHCFAL
jgi:hypothetical protein